VRYLAHEPLRSARSCSPLTSSAPLCQHCKMFYLPGQSLIRCLRISCRRVGFRKLRGPLTEICLPKLVLVKGQIGVDGFCASVEISTKHLCCVHCAPELFASQHAYTQWPRRGDR